MSQLELVLEKECDFVSRNFYSGNYPSGLANDGIPIASG